MRTNLYNKGVCSIHLGQELNERIEKECQALGLSKSLVARFLFKKWLSTNQRNRHKTDGATLVLDSGWDHQEVVPGEARG